MPLTARKIGEVKGRKERPSRARERARHSEINDPAMHMQTRSRSRDNSQTRYAYFTLEWEPRSKSPFGTRATSKSTKRTSKPRTRKKTAVRRHQGNQDDEYEDVNVEEVVGDLTDAPVRAVDGRQVDDRHRAKTRHNAEMSPQREISSENAGELRAADVRKEAISNSSESSINEAEKDSSSEPASKPSSRFREKAKRQSTAPRTTSAYSQSKMQSQMPQRMKPKPKLKNILPQWVEETDELRDAETEMQSEMLRAQNTDATFDAFNVSSSLVKSPSFTKTNQPNPSIFDVSGLSTNIEKDAAWADPNFDANITIRSSRHMRRVRSTLNFAPEELENAGEESEEDSDTEEPPQSLNFCPPVLSPSSDERDKIFVRLPHEQSKWKDVEESLAEPIKDIEALKMKMRRYKPGETGELWGIEHLLSERGIAASMLTILRRIQNQALQLPNVAGDQRIPLLRPKRNDCCTLGKSLIRALLANGFLCTFANDDAGDPRSATGPRLNFAGLLEADDIKNKAMMQKLLGLLRYLRMEPFDGAVTVTRVYLLPEEAPNWQALDIPFSGVDVHLQWARGEDSRDACQLICTDGRLGDGVFGPGVTLEDIAFVTFPELLVTRLLVESLGKNEALLVDGVHRVVVTSGCGESFRVEGTYRADEEPRTVAIVQPGEPVLDEEFVATLNNLYAAMRGWKGTVVASLHGRSWQTTGFLLVAMAAAAQKLQLQFYCNDQKVWYDDIHLVYQTIVENNLKVATVLRVLCDRDRAGGEPLLSCLKNCSSA